MIGFLLVISAMRLQPEIPQRDEQLTPGYHSELTSNELSAFRSAPRRDRGDLQIGYRDRMQKSRIPTEIDPGFFLTE